jgi:hypothetical protein
MKVTAGFYRVRAGVARGELFERLIEQIGCPRAKVSVDQVAIDQSPLARAGMRVWEPPPWDVLVQCDNVFDLPDGPTIAGVVDSGWVLAVDQTLRWERYEPQGVRFTSLVARLPGLSNDVFRTRYAAHADVARTHHGGCVRYVQSVVAAPAVGPTGTEVDAISELSFTSAETLADRLYTYATSPDAVRSDTSQFLDFSHACSVLSDERWIDQPG